MTWFKVDDQFWGHPKQTALPKGAVCLWVRAGSWSASLLTNGFVPAHMVAMLGCSKGDAKALVTAELWEDADGGYQFHDWNVYQPTRDQVEEKREEDARRKAEWRRKRAAQRAASQARPEDVPMGHDGDKDVSHTSVPDMSRSSRPDPTRPDPDSSKEESSSSAGPRKRGHRLPDGFAPNDDLAAWARDRGFNDGQIAEMTDRFRDYWQSTPGSKGVKSNWDMAWRNWVGKEDPKRVRSAVPMYDTSKLPQPGMGWAPEQVDMVLGKDTWTAPAAPAGMDEDQAWDWQQLEIRRHRAARIQAANKAIGRDVA